MTTLKNLFASSSVCLIMAKDFPNNWEMMCPREKPPTKRTIQKKSILQYAQLLGIQPELKQLPIPPPPFLSDSAVFPVPRSPRRMPSSADLDFSMFDSIPELKSIPLQDMELPSPVPIPVPTKPPSAMLDVWRLRCPLSVYDKQQMELMMNPQMTESLVECDIQLTDINIMSAFFTGYIPEPPQYPKRHPLYGKPHPFGVRPLYQDLNRSGIVHDAELWVTKRMGEYLFYGCVTFHRSIAGSRLHAQFLAKHFGFYDVRAYSAVVDTPCYQNSTDAARIAARTDHTTNRRMRQCLIEEETWEVWRLP